MIPDYLVIGHVTKDLLPDGGFTLGGTATYSALAAHRLGLQVGVLTSTEPGLPIFDDVSHNGHIVLVKRRSATYTTTFENIYAPDGRKQYVRAVASVLTSDDLPISWRATPIVHLGPIAQEVSTDLARVFATALVGVTPQGWFRQWDDQGSVSFVDWRDASLVLDVADVVVLSMEDLAHDRDKLARYVRQARVLVLTLGSRGATVYHKGQTIRVPAFAVSEVDPTGAGDVFATAFLIRYAETEDLLEAARFANCTASFVIEGMNTTTIPTREQVEWRLRHGRLRTDL